MRLDFDFYLLVAVTFFGFVALAALLLVPVYRFIRREEKVAEDWTHASIARRQRRSRTSGDGAAGPPPPAEPPAEPPPDTPTEQDTDAHPR